MPARRMPLAVFLPLLVVVVPAPARAQQQVFRGGVDIIEIDVSVIDGRGRPIADLLSPEFTVSIDGRPRKVVSTEFVSLRPTAPDLRQVGIERTEPAVSSNTASSHGRLIVIGVDRDSISFGGGRTAMRAAGAFLDRLGPGDRVALFTVPLQGPVVDFTANHQVVRRELDRIVGLARRPQGTLNIGVSEAIALNSQRNPFLADAVLDRLCGELPPGSTALRMCETDVHAEAAAITQEIRTRTDHSIRALESILEALREVDGPKSLVWISEGMVLEHPSDVSTVAALATAARTTITVITLDEPLIDVSEQQTSPSSVLDRDARIEGLEVLAGMARGALFRVTAGADDVFRRIEEEMSGYYLLAVESSPGDGDGKRHPIKVSVGRRGATVRARAEFQADRAVKPETVQERLARTLRSPFVAAELPLRMATYAYHDGPTGKVRVAVATEVARSEKSAADLSLGFVLTDTDGNIAAQGTQKVSLTPTEGSQGLVVEHLGGMLMDPGTYVLKLAVIDQNGKRGSIEHTVQAWQMSGVPFAVGDLMLGDVPGTGGHDLRPTVEPRLANGRLAAYMELYAERPDFFDTATVRIEIARDESGPALASGPGQLVASDNGSRRRVWAEIPLAVLPPGPYVARALVARGDEKVGQLSRLFHVETASAETRAAAAVVLPSMLAVPPAFRKADVLAAGVIASVMDLLDTGRPALRAATAAARKGNFTGVARQAFEAGDQFASMFLRGLELFSKGDLNQAATQLTGALREVPDFGPALLFLGASYAAAGRDREAAATWQRALASPAPAPVAYRAFADAAFRLGDTQRAIAPLREGMNRWPDDDELRRRLAIAYEVGLQHADALAIVQPYLDRHPTDPDALLVAVHAVYSARLAGQPLLGPDQEKARAATWAHAYSAAKGPHDALVATWADFVAR